MEVADHPPDVDRCLDGLQCDTARAGKEESAPPSIDENREHAARGPTAG